MKYLLTTRLHSSSFFLSLVNGIESSFSFNSIKIPSKISLSFYTLIPLAIHISSQNMIENEKPNTRDKDIITIFHF